MAKRGLIVGVNYPGTSHELRGCVNDALAMEEILRRKFGFTNIRLLLDEEATTDNILSELETLVSGSKKGDILFFHFSGHGSQYPDNPDLDHEPDGLDEIICPIDLNWRDKMIRDDHLKSIFDKVPDGVNLTVILDCCNSGGGLDQENQYQPLGETQAIAYVDPVKNGRYLPPPPEAIELMESRDLIFKKQRSLTHRNVNRTGLLISGCQSHQTSADAFLNGKFMGACTYMLLQVLKDENYDCTYRDLIDKLNDKMVEYKFTQRPELNGSASLFEFKFLQQLVSTENTLPNDTEDDLISLSDPSLNVEDVENLETVADVLTGGNDSIGELDSGDMITENELNNGNLNSNDGKNTDNIFLQLLFAVVLAIVIIGVLSFFI